MSNGNEAMKRIEELCTEIIHATECLKLISGEGGTPLESSVQWIVPKITAAIDGIEAITEGAGAIR